MAEIVLETRGLTKYFGSKIAVDHLDLKLETGSVCGFLGRNGAGKTTVIKMLLGLLKPTCGQSKIFGCDSQDLTNEIRQQVGYVAEGHHLFGWMKIGEIQKFQSAFFPGQWEDKFFDDMMDYFQLLKNQKVKHLSNGQREQVSLALTLAANPTLLIMDDPTLGLDAAIRRQFLEGMIELIIKQGRTILFSSHILSDVERVADRLVVIDKGILLADCKIEEFRDAVKKVRFTFADNVPAKVEMEGILQKRADGKELELTLVNSSVEAIEKWAAQNNAKDFAIINMNLEDQFIEFTEPLRERKLFRWEESCYEIPGTIQKRRQMPAAVVYNSHGNIYYNCLLDNYDIKLGREF